MNTSQNPHEKDNEPSPDSVHSSEDPATDASPSKGSDEGAGTAADSAPGDDQLPEIEPLTPELVEEEALRGDFMLRWFVVLLALILGCTEIKDTTTLVRIRTGEYLASHGWLPPATDVFSYTAVDLPWINIAWLGDLLLAGLFHAGGEYTLSIVGGIMAALTFWLLTRATRPGVSTWWGSACGALGLLATFPLLTIGPNAITVLGLAALMSLLAHAESEPASRAIWALPILMIVWVQLDEHAFLGLILLIAYSIGHTVDAPSEDSAAPVGRMWGCVAACVVGMLLHPFHINTLMAFLSLHTDVYPAHSIYAAADQDFHSRWLPLTDRDFWQTLAVPSVAGLLIAVVALVTMLLNAGRLRWSHAVVWLVINGFAIAAGRQLYAAAVVNVVLASLNGQDWYRASFRQAYSVETGELIFSRGGRAVTVLALLALGCLAASGRLMGPDIRRIGIGFDAQLAAQIESFQDVLEDSLDDRPFNFRLEQGDLLIWIGQRPFIDSRLGIYTQGDPSLTDDFRRIRLALRRPAADDPNRGRSEVWQEPFERYGVSHVIPRLTGEDPDYSTLMDLLTTRRWGLARLGAATAALYDYESPEPGVAEFLVEHPGDDFVNMAFRDATEDTVLLDQSVWPQRRTVYQELLTASPRAVSNDIQLARHYTRLLNEFRGAIAEDQMVALAYLAIRHAWSGLAEHPNAVEGYISLAEAHGYLLEIHQIVQQQWGAPVAQLLSSSDVSQVQSALLSAVACRPDDERLHLVVAQFLLSQDKVELALNHLLKFEQLNGSLSPVEPDHPNYTEVLEQYQQLVTSLEAQVQGSQEELEIQLLSGIPPVQVVGMAVNSGMTAEALRLLEEDATIVAQDPQAQVLHAHLLLEVGRVEEALTKLESLETAIVQSAPFLLVDWNNTTAIANLTTGNHKRAVDLWDEQIQQLTTTELQVIMGLTYQPGTQPGLGTAPLIYTPPFVQDLKPMLRSVRFGNLLLTYSTQWGNAQLQKGLSLLQQGRVTEATQTMTAILEYDPESQLRPLIAFYLSIVTGEPQIFTPPSDEIPITGDMFAPDDPDDEAHGLQSDDDSAADGNDADSAIPSLPRPPPERRAAERN